MGRFDTTKATINANIKKNGNQEITGSILNSVMTEMVDATDAQLTELSAELVKNMLLSEAFTVQSCTRDKYGDINSAIVTWADGIDGKIDIVRNSDGTPSRIDMKYGTKWYILTIIRDGNGDVISSTIK